MVKVTFTNNVDHYVRGDQHELSKDELARVDAYVKKWKIEHPYVKGDATEEQLAVELKNPRKRSSAKRAPVETNAKAETKAKPAAKKPAAPKAPAKATGEGDTPEDVKQPEETAPATELPEDKGNPATEGEGENPEATDLEPAGGEPATDEGSKPKVETK